MTVRSATRLRADDAGGAGSAVASADFDRRSVFEAVGVHLEAVLEDVLGECVARTSEMPELGDLADDAAFWGAIRRSARATVLSAATCLADGGVLPDALPAETSSLIGRWTQRRLPLGILLADYRHVHAVIWPHAEAAARKRASMAGGASAEALRSATAHLSEFLFAWIDRLSLLATTGHQDARGQHSRGRAAIWNRAVRNVLAGDETELELVPYDLNQCHVAFIASGEGIGSHLREIADALEARSLAVVADDTVTWLWAGRGSLTTQDVERALRRLSALVGSRIAFGDAMAGVEGFRRSHRQAAEAYEVSSRPCVVSYDAVALEVLSLRSVGHAREVVERELLELADASSRSRVLRETLRAYFSSGQNGASAAALLEVHEQTVSYRLRTIEERLGRRVTQRRAELETALRVHESFDTGEAPLA